MYFESTRVDSPSLLWNFPLRRSSDLSLEKPMITLSYQTPFFFLEALFWHPPLVINYWKILWPFFHINHFLSPCLLFDPFWGHFPNFCIYTACDVSLYRLQNSFVQIEVCLEYTVCPCDGMGGETAKANSFCRACTVCLYIVLQVLVCSDHIEHIVAQTGEIRTRKICNTCVACMLYDDVDNW